MLIKRPLFHLFGLAIFFALARAETAEKRPTSLVVKHARVCQNRLPNNVRPLEYDINLEFINGFASLRGEVTTLIAISPLRGVRSPRTLSNLLSKLCQPTQYTQSNGIVLHLSGDLDILSAKCKIANSAEQLQDDEGTEIKIKQIIRDNQKQMIAIELDGEMQIATNLFAKLTLAYESSVPNPSLLVRADWHDTDTLRAEVASHWLANFQHGQARNLMPCFDEPQLKAQIKLRATTSNHGVDLVTNLNKRGNNLYETKIPMPISGLVLSFKTRPLLNSGRGARLSGKLGTGVEVTVTGPEEASSELDSDRAQWTLQFACRCLEWMQETTKVKYPLERLQLAAVPSNIKWNISDGPGLGLINHKYFLADQSANGDEDERQRVATYERQVEAALNVALVVARQWFGYALAPDGWSNLWITEGLAARAALNMVHQLEPALEVYHYVRFNHLRRALALDIGDNFPPISHPNGDHPNQAQDAHISPSAFNMIRLIKSAAIMQLLEKTLANNFDFNQAISSLMASKLAESPNSSVSLLGLVDALSNGPHGRDLILDLLKPWVQLSGSPTFSLSVDDDLSAISVRQMPSIRLDSRGERVRDDAGLWPVSIRFNFYSKVDLLHNEVELLETIKRNKLSSKKSKATVRLGLPGWLRNVPAKIEVAEDYQVLPYYQLDCSKSAIICRSL